jgi:hypothetical protein
VKLKTCTGCGKEKPIWKNHEGGKYCKECWSCHKSKELPQKPKLTPSSSKLKQKSDKQKAIDKAYSLMRKEYLTKNPLCKMNIPGVCTGSASDVHHSEYRGIQTLAQSTWIPACRACHDWVHANPKDARVLGLIK